MEAELQSLEENHIFDVIINDVNQKVLQGRWVFKLKRGPKAEILRYKSRWVVCGFEQKYGIDYEDTFAAVVKPMRYGALFALTNARGRLIH
jgi:hypothetical protein